MSASRDYFPGCNAGPSGGRGAPRGAGAALPFGPPVEWDACITCGQHFAAAYRIWEEFECEACQERSAPSTHSTTGLTAFVDAVARAARTPREAT